MKPHNRKPATICAGFVFLLLASRAGVAPFPSVDREKAVVAYREGNALFDQGLFSQAIAAYNQAIAEDPQYVQAYHNLALASEMVDRQQAIAAWKRFVDIAVDREEYKFDVARIRARIQILESLPPLPDSLLASRYVPESGDYYWQVSRGSEGEE